MTKSLTWRPPTTDTAWPRRARRVAAVVLRAASAALSRLARYLASTDVRKRSDPLAAQLEFYAEAGAPEGALYADGVLVGFVTGVKRL